MKEKLETIKKQAKERIEEIKDLQALNELKVKILGKKGELTEILRGMKDLSPEERPIIGSLVNTVRDEIEGTIKSAEELLKHHELIRVATKYPRIAKDYFYNKKHQTVEIIKLNGSIELAPIVGLSEVIVDIVETGTTLRENGLSVLEEVCPLSARMVVNQVSMKMENERITKIIRDLKEVLAKENGK